MKEYIERDLLKTMIQRDINECYEKDMASDYMKGYHNGLTMAYAMVLGMHDAADVVERVRGEWSVCANRYGEKATCSVCKHEMWVNDGWNGLMADKDLHFCPNCGADMRGGKDER